MRIISGKHRRRKIQGPPDAETTRPIPDLVKGALFNLLRGHYEDAAVFDAFSGSGAIGLEAASRGASRVVMVERDRKIASIIERNIETLGEQATCELVTADALGPAALARCPRPVNLVFMDPPYPLVRDEQGWQRVKAQFTRLIELLTDDGFAVLRTPWPFIRLPEQPEAQPTDQAPPPPVVEVDLSDDADHDALDDAEAFFGQLTGPKPKPVDIDLTMDGAEGPETHVYRHTAIHLYMRAKPGQPETQAEGQPSGERPGPTPPQ